MTRQTDLVVLYEHPEWQKPLFAALDAEGVDYMAVDLTKGAFDAQHLPTARLYFNQASPSAYLRGHTRAVPYALALMEDLEAQGMRVLNGSRAFRLELSKIAQSRLMFALGIDHPRSVAFNDVAALRAHNTGIAFPALLKPNQGGSGARMYKVNTWADIEELLPDDSPLWAPDHLFVLQEYLGHDPRGDGIVRLEFMGGELLYAMKVRSSGSFNLCPSEVCHPGDGGEGTCAVPTTLPTTFEPFVDVPVAAVDAARRIFVAGGLDIGGIEYLETPDGRRVFYDVNANSNLRRPVALAFGFDPFERVAQWLLGLLAAG